MPNQLSESTAIVALDIDGVLNCSDSGDLIHDNLAMRLGMILHETGAAILLTSSWQRMIANGDMSLCGFSFMLRACGCHPAHVVGCTQDVGRIGEDSKLELIRRWLARHAPRSGYVILDDQWLEGAEDRLVQTNLRRGLTDADVMKAVSIALTPLPRAMPEHYGSDGNAE